MRPPILSRETLSKFSNEFYERKMARQRKKREEKKLERKIEKSLAMDSFGRSEESYVITFFNALMMLREIVCQ